jgi:FeS assembly SUF system protein
MGMFSFLKDKQDGQDPATPAASTSPATPTAPAAADAPGIAATPSDTTFVRPAAWDAPALDTSALTAPAAAAASSENPEIGPLDPANTAEMQQPIIDAIKTVFDPEIPVDIYELGLIYDIIVDADKKVLVNMTLTSPACPSAQQIPSEVRWKVKAVPGVTDAKVEIAWEPMWTKDRMSEAAKLQLGFF